MKKTTFIAVAIAAISFISIIALFGSFLVVRSELSAGYELARLESSSPYGHPETSEEIQAKVKEAYSKEGLFLRIASGNVPAPKATAIIVFMWLSFLGSVCSLIHSKKVAAKAAEKKRRERIKSEFSKKMSELGY